jgi:hypothetical protein
MSAEADKRTFKVTVRPLAIENRTGATDALRLEALPRFPVPADGITSERMPPHPPFTRAGHDRLTVAMPDGVTEATVRRTWTLLNPPPGGLVALDPAGPLGTAGGCPGSGV